VETTMRIGTCSRNGRRIFLRIQLKEERLLEKNDEYYDARSEINDERTFPQ
jgi:hypothetical protein